MTTPDVLSVLAGLGSAAYHGYQKYKQWYPGGRKPYRGAWKYDRKSYKKMKYMCRPEMHYLDVTGGAAPAAPAVGGTVVSLNSIGEGTEYNQRNARIIIAKYIQYDFIIQIPTNSGADDFYQIAIVYDRDTSGSLPTYAQIFDTSVSPVGMAFKNIAANQDQFQILKTLKGHVSAGPPHEVLRLRGMIKIPLKLSRVVYSSAGVSIPESGGFVLVFASLANSGTQVASYALAYNIRFGYHDC
jgi:hypothetical protein